MFIVLAASGLAVAAIAATGVRSLRNFSSHELEEVCQRHNKDERFDEILDQHDAVALGVECLQVLGCVLFFCAGAAWLVDRYAGQTGAVNLPWLGMMTAASVTVLLLATNVWIPWTFSRIWAPVCLCHGWILWKTASQAMRPLTVGVEFVDALTRRLAGKPEHEEHDEEYFEDEIRTVVTAGHREGLLEADAREMIEGVIDLEDTDVSEIMTQRSNVDALEIGMPWNEIVRFVIEAGRTRLPVYEEKLDNVVGVLFVKDLLAELAKPPDETRRSLRELLRPRWSVPATKAVNDMLQEFLNTRSHLAIVVDEYDSVAGVVTIEDVLEEIVGEIVDESDRDEEAEIVRINDSTAEVQGQAHLDEINEELELEIQESDQYDTIAGLLLHRLGHIPKAGESIVENGIRIAVTDATHRRINRVLIEVLSHDELAR